MSHAPHESSPEPTSWSLSASEKLPAPPLFLLERFSHTRCSCILSGAQGLHLIRASIRVHGSILVVKCDCVPRSGAPVRESCWLEVDVGETINTTSSSCTLANGFAYAQLVLARSASDFPATAFRKIREDVGLCRRAAEQRRRELAAMRGAWLRCRGCSAGLARIAFALPLPDPDASCVADFMQCCQDNSFDWACMRPAKLECEWEVASNGTDMARTGRTVPPVPSTGAAADGRSVTCYLAKHTLHLDVVPPSTTMAAATVFAGTRCARHTNLAGRVGLWATLHCARCSQCLGAASQPVGYSAPRCERDNRGARDSGRVDDTTLITAPLWFEECAGAEVKRRIQLLKCCVSADRGARRDAARPSGHHAGSDLATVARIRDGDTLSCYTVAATVGEAILRAAEENDQARHFSLSGADYGAPTVLLVLLRPYVTLSTNFSATVTTQPMTNALKVCSATSLLSP